MGIVAAFAVPHPPLIIPAVGQGRQSGIQKTIDAYEEVGRRIAKLAPQTIVVSTPHSVMYRDYNHISPGTHASGSFAQFGAPQARYEATYDQEFTGLLAQTCEREGLAAGTDYERDATLDHATMIPLHFIQKYYRDFKLVRIGLSGLSPADHYRLGMAVQKVANQLDRRVVYVASGDLSHKLTSSGPYGYAPDGPKFDQEICRIFTTGDFLGLLTMDRGFADRAAECGLRSFQIMAGALDGVPVKCELLSHEGPFGVGYGVAAFTPTGTGPDDSRRFLQKYQEWHHQRMEQLKAHEDPLVGLARNALETYVRTHHRLQVPKDLPQELYSTRAGCFVSLKENGELRGCIGTIAPTQDSLAQEICNNAVSAGCHDPRFMPVHADELDELVYSVDVLGKPEPIQSQQQLDPRRYGVIVSTSDGRRGLLLPDLDGVDTPSEQVRIAARKGGIDPDEDDVQLQRFQVVRHH
ncbi:MAG: AmmeMemoRadiSam system protein A [Atopobiaceae bacterium]